MNQIEKAYRDRRLDAERIESYAADCKARADAQRIMLRVIIALMAGMVVAAAAGVLH